MNKQDTILSMFSGGYKGPKEFHFKPNNLIEDNIICEMRKMLYNCRNGHLSQPELLKKLENINKNTNRGFNCL